MSGTAHRLALIGLGEVGQTLAADLLGGAERCDMLGDGRNGVRHVAAWDRLLPIPGSAPARNLAKLAGLRGASGLRDALAEATLVISAVTAGECVAAAREAATSLRPGAYYFDLNSVSPAAREEASRHIEFAGGRFVECAVMSPIAPKHIASPMLLGGPHAREFLPVAKALGFGGATVFADVIGRASAAKMCRSIMVKGMEALLAESMLAARHHGVDQTVLDSLSDLFPGVEWRKAAHYMISRSLQHGRRRAEEMREAAQTAHEAGLTPWMSRACVERQTWAAGHAEALRHEELEDMLDALLEQTETA